MEPLKSLPSPEEAIKDIIIRMFELNLLKKIGPKEFDYEIDFFDYYKGVE